MAEPAMRPYSNQFYGRIFSRSRLRDQLGPDDPMFHLLESLAIKDVYNIEDDFMGTLNADLWTTTTSGGGNSATFVLATDIAGGVLRGDTGDDSEADIGINSTLKGWAIDNRPIAITRLKPEGAIANSKFEFGFADADAAGQVNVKATPTSTGSDYAVIIRDTDDDTSIDMVCDGTTPAVESVAGTHGVTWTLSAWHTFMIALNEQDEAYFWANGSLGGRIDGNGPDNDVALLTFLYMQTRTTADRYLDVDYIKALGERVAL